MSSVQRRAERERDSAKPKKCRIEGVKRPNDPLTKLLGRWVSGSFDTFNSTFDMGRLTFDVEDFTVPVLSESATGDASCAVMRDLR